MLNRNRSRRPVQRETHGAKIWPVSEPDSAAEIFDATAPHAQLRPGQKKRQPSAIAPGWRGRSQELLCRDRIDSARWPLAYSRRSRIIHTALKHRGRFHSDDPANSFSKTVREVSRNPKRRAKNSLAVAVNRTTLSTPFLVARSRTVKREPIPQP